MTAMTIPAMAPGLRPLLWEAKVMGRVLPVAVAGAMKPTVVVADVVVVVALPLVGRRGADAVAIVLVTVGTGMDA